MLIQEIFGEENLVEIYGAIECGILGFELKRKGFLYPSLDTHIIELDNDGIVNKARGNCIVTALDIFSFPLIRYRLGDWIEMEDFEGYPVIKSILGRLDDWITWKDGSRIPFHFFAEFKSCGLLISLNVQYCQIIWTACLSCFDKYSVSMVNA